VWGILLEFIEFVEFVEFIWFSPRCMEKMQETRPDPMTLLLVEQKFQRLNAPEKLIQVYLESGFRERRKKRN
jgi:hypothetical protein